MAPAVGESSSGRSGRASTKRIDAKVPDMLFLEPPADEGIPLIDSWSRSSHLGFRLVIEDSA